MTLGGGKVFATVGAMSDEEARACVAGVVRYRRSSRHGSKTTTNILINLGPRLAHPRRRGPAGLGDERLDGTEYHTDC